MADALGQWPHDFHLDTPVIHQLALRTMAMTHEANLLLSCWSEIQRDPPPSENELDPVWLSLVKAAKEKFFSDQAQVDLPSLTAIVGWAKQRGISFTLVVKILDYVLAEGEEGVQQAVANSWQSLPYRVKVVDGDYFEFSTFSWLPDEPRSAAKCRITTAFEAALESHLTEGEEFRTSKGMERSKIPADLDLSAEWLVQFQVNEKTIAQIADEASDYDPEVGRKMVPRRIDQAANLLAGSESWLRRRQPGRPKTRPHD